MDLVYGPCTKIADMHQFLDRQPEVCLYVLGVFVCEYHESKRRRAKGIKFDIWLNELE